MGHIVRFRRRGLSGAPRIGSTEDVRHFLRSHEARERRRQRRRNVRMAPWFVLMATCGAVVAFVSVFVVTEPVGMC